MKCITPKILEAQFLGQVVELARACGWYVVHFRPARTERGWRTACQFDAAGWPDIFATRGPQKFAAELKVGRNKPSREQKEWAVRLEAAGVPFYWWSPDSWDEIESVLRDGPGG